LWSNKKDKVDENMQKGMYRAPPRVTQEAGDAHEKRRSGFYDIEVKNAEYGRLAGGWR